MQTRPALVLTAACALLLGASSNPSERRAAVMEVLDQYLSALNALDLEGHTATYHFPHYRHASGEVIVWANALEANPILGVPPEARKQRLRAALAPDWDRSEWVHREIVQADDTKVHVVTRFARLRADGSVIATFDSLYVLTYEDGHWGIRGRSSFAP